MAMLACTQLNFQGWKISGSTCLSKDTYQSHHQKGVDTQNQPLPPPPLTPPSYFFFQFFFVFFCVFVGQSKWQVMDEINANVQHTNDPVVRESLEVAGRSSPSTEVMVTSPRKVSNLLLFSFFALICGRVSSQQQL